MQPTVAALAKMIDHSLLHPTMTDRDLEAGCALAARYRTATVCIKPYAVSAAARWLAGSGVGICTVAGFPHGGNETAIKVAEAQRSCDHGATEIDVVVNIGKVLGDDWRQVEEELRAVQAAVVARKAILKVIFENDFLDDARIVMLCRICADVGVAFVKTSTGYGFVKQADGSYTSKGATDAHLRLMRANSPSSVQIKAAGGVRTLDDLIKVRDVGVTRIGATATAAIIDAAVQRGFPGAADFAHLGGGTSTANAGGY
ncbi:MAG TPA: deoxyribose-phosphate aldolase [Planctomycetota bacterium]|nr:deoxyribose-phosphate aldolase [Planctomycetota bacterium]